MGKKAGKTRQMTRSQIRKQIFESAKFSLVDRSNQPVVKTFVVSGVLSCHRHSKVASVGKWTFSKPDLESFGYTVKNGQSIHVLVKQHYAAKRSLYNCCIVKRIDNDLRSLSDMRTKPAWSELPWLEPAIDAIYAERDRITMETGIPHHVDHIHPVNHPRLCGLTVPWNLQILSATENIRKGNKLWVPSLQ